MRTKLFSAVVGTVLVLSLTTACQAPSPDISSEKAEQLQSRVLAVTTAVADGGYAAALEALTVLETELDAAAADGSVSFARHQRIEAALALVRQDVQAAIDAAAKPTPAPTPVETVAPVDEGDDNDDVEEDTETKDEKKAREAAEKALEDAAKKAEEERKKAEDEAKKKAEDEAKKQAEDEKKSTETPQDGEEGDG